MLTQNKKYLLSANNMKKEDYQSTSGFPIDIVFIPEAFQIDFKEKIKLQIAFYRNNKVCKSSPVKFLKTNCHNSIIKLQPQKLQFCTTLAYDKNSKQFESKIINVQVAFQTDSNKQTIQGKIDLKDVLPFQSSFQLSNLVVNFKNDSKLFYKVVGKIANFKPMESASTVSPFKRHLQIEQSVNQSHKKYEHKQKQLVTRVNEEKQNENMKKMNAEKDAKTKQLEVQIQSSHKKIKQIDEKLREAIKKYDDLLQQNSNYKMKLKQSESSLQQKQKQYIEMQKLYQRVTEQKNMLLGNLGKSNSNQQQNSKKYLHQIEKLTQQVNNLRQHVNQYKNKNSELKKTESQMLAKYQESERKNVALTAQIEEIKYKLEKQQKQKQKLSKKIEKLQKQLHENQKPQATQSQSKQSQKSKQNEILKLSKMIETKQQMIKMLKKQTEIKKNQQNEDLNIMKKQNKELKEEIEKLKDPKRDAVYLELKVSNERFKKQSMEAKRQEKKMIAQKAEIQAKSKDMTNEIIKLKQSIARMVNLVQQFGSQDLVAQVTECLA